MKAYIDCEDINTYESMGRTEELRTIQIVQTKDNQIKIYVNGEEETVENVEWVEVTFYGNFIEDNSSNS